MAGQTGQNGQTQVHVVLLAVEALKRDKGAEPALTPPLLEHWKDAMAPVMKLILLLATILHVHVRLSWCTTFELVHKISNYLTFWQV